jgi:Ca-activated chloride channel family protein
MRTILSVMGTDMNFSDFNFASPFWLLGLILIPLGWAWYKYWGTISKTNLHGLNKFIDQTLLPHLLIKTNSKHKQVNYGWIYGALTFFIVIALANPRWSFDELDAYHNTASMVILFDLSASMNATDVAPSRIVSARQNVEDLINLSKGLKIGLIGFAGNAHLISPITDDLETIRNYIPALDTDLTNLQGNSLHVALRMGAELLANEPGERKSILLVSDGNFAVTDFSKELASLSAKDIKVHVLGIGTATGAPYKNNSGALHKSHGKLVISKLNSAVLQTIAKQGHGVYTEAVHNDVGVKAILAKASQTDIDQKIVAGKVRQWQDRYYWFIFPVAILLLYLIRQRVLYSFILILSMGFLATPDAHAVEFSSFFKNSEQKGQQAYINADFENAAALFNNSYNKGVALYRNGDYAKAERYFKAAQYSGYKIPALYNAGNSQMQQRKWRAAIKSYETVLQDDPDHFAAQHNLKIAMQMLAEQPEKDESQDDEDQNEEQQDDQQQDQQQSGKNKTDSKQQDKEAEQEKQDNKQQDQKNAIEQQKNDSDKNDDSKPDASLNADVAMIDQERAQQWLNRVDSDIKVFLKNKFYIEDVLSAP